MPRVLEEIVWFVAVIVLLPYTLGPFAIWLTFRQKAYATFRVMQPHQLPLDVQRFFGTSAPDLAREGFVVTAYLSNAGSVAGVSAYVAAWANAERGQLAHLLYVSPAVGRATKVLAFETITAPDAVAVMTNNLKENAASTTRCRPGTRRSSRGSPTRPSYIRST